MPYVMTTCPFCGCGCGLYVQVDGNRVVGVAPSPGHPVGQGRLCVKGWHAHELSTSPSRLLSPLVRRAGQIQETGWDEALDLVAHRLAETKAAHGSQAVGVLGSARGTNEDNFLLAKFTRSCLATNNVDLTARLEALPGLFDLPRYRRVNLPVASIGDVDQADLILLWLSDPAQEHPALAARILRAAQRGTPIIEVGARSWQMTGLARYRLHPRPGTDVHLACGLLHALVSSRGAEPGTEKLAVSVADFTPERTETATGVSASLVSEVGQALASANRPLAISTRATTIGQHAADVLMCLSALSSLSQRASESWSSLLLMGQYNNLQGARDMGVTPYFLAGYQPVTDAEVRARFGRAWGVEIPSESGLSAWDMLGKVRALLVMGDDPVRLLPDASRARDALSRLEFLAVLDTFPSATTEAADVVLPGASFAEKDGTFTSADRTVQRVRRAVPPPGQARPEWQVLCDLSHRMGRPMRYDSPGQVMEEIASLTPLYKDISYAALERVWGVQWSPLNGSGAGQMVPADEDLVPVEEEALPAADGQYPFLLTPDYTVGAWADDPTVLCSASLRRELGADRPVAVPVVEVSAADAEKLELRDGQKVRIRSRRGEMEAVVKLTPALCAGVLALPFRMREAAAQVMPPSVDPETGVPRLEPCAVSVEKA